MNSDEVNARGLVLLGCGKMGSAMLAGWLEAGVKPSAVTILDPNPSDWLLSIEGLQINQPLPENPAACLLAVKPQMMGAALDQLQALAGGSVMFLSIAAGVTLDGLAAMLGQQEKIIRAMPNTPAAIGQGITALIGNTNCAVDDTSLAADLLAAIGKTVVLEDEVQMDAVTGLSGSGPAYVFHMIEAMTKAGIAQGLPEELAATLALETVAGAGALAKASDESPSKLRENVTSPNGTTQAGLDVLMDEENGLPKLMEKTVHAASERSRELGRG